jgi:hypothetical protein
MSKPATTMAEFSRKPDSQKRSLMILATKDAATSLITRYFYFSDIGGDLSGIYWHPMIDAIPDLSYNSREIGGSATPSWSDAKLRNEDGYDISHDRTGIYMEDLGTTWVAQDQLVVCYFGGDDLPLSEYAQVFYGTCQGIKHADQGPTLDLSGLENQTKRKTVGSNKVTVAAYPNCGTNAGKPKPVAIGYCWNCEPILVDFVAYQYMYHENSSSTLYSVYANGVALTTPAQYTDNGDGTFTLAAAPTGRITCAIGGPYAFTPWASVLSGVLQTWGGISAGQIDATAVAAANIVLPFYADRYITVETSVFEVIKSLSDGVPAWWGFQKSGIFSMREVTDPSSGTTDWEISSEVSSEIPIAFIDGSLTVGQASTPVYRTNVQYLENNAPTSTNQLSGTLTEAQKMTFVDKYRKDYYQDTSVLTPYPLAGANEITLRSSSAAHAVSAATKWVNLLKVPRRLVRLTVKAMELGYEKGDIVELTYKTELKDGSDWYRHGLNATKLMITSIKENYSRAEITLELWG